MYFDDRLATVLRTGIGSDRAMCTQFRQLLDLLGTLSDNAEGPLVDAAFARLGLLSQELAAPQRGAMIREPGVRLSSSRLVTILASHEAEVASATDRTSMTVLRPCFKSLASAIWCCPALTCSNCLTGSKSLQSR